MKISEAQTILVLFDLKDSVTNSEISHLRQEEKNLISSLPKVDKSRIDKIKKDLLLVSPSEVMMNLMGTFSYSIPRIEYTLSIFKSESSISKSCTIYIFVSLVSFLFYQKSQALPSEFQTFFKALFRTLNTPAFNPFSTFFFHELLNKGLTELTIEKWTDDLIATICNYIIYDTNLTISFYPTFETFCNLVFTKDSSISIECLLTSIGKLYEAKSQFILFEDQTGMIQLLEPFALQKNPHIFKIVSAISQISQNASVKNIYFIFLNGLYKQITQESQKIEISRIHSNTLIIPDVEVSIPNNFQFIESHHPNSFFSKGLSSIPAQLYESINIWSIVSDEFNRDISTFSTFLQKSHADCIDFFFSGLSHFLDSNQAECPSIFLLATIAIIRLLKHIETPIRRDLFMSLFITNDFFKSKETIFDENGLDVYSNLYRNHVISFLIDEDIEIILHNYFSQKQYLFYVELIGRILALQREESLLKNCRQQFFNDVFELSLLLQSIYIDHIHSYQIYEARSILFLLLLHMSSHPSFRDEECLEIFGHFLFETEVQNIALSLLKSNLCILEKREMLIEFIRLILSKCIDNNKDRRYFDLFSKILASLNEMVCSHHQISEIAICLFDSLMRCFEAFPDREILIKMLRLISLNSYLLESFDLRNKDKRFISNFIQSNSIFDKEVYSRFMSLLTNWPTFPPSIYEDTDVCFIEKSKFIPIFCSSFCKSPYFLKFLEILSVSCQHSPFVAEKCHEGSLDYILLEYIRISTDHCIFEYDDMTFDLSFSTKFLKKVIRPLLITIFSTKTSYSIVFKLLQLCKSHNSLALSLIQDSIAPCSRMIHPLYLISTHDSVTSGKTSSSHLNLGSHFSFSFWLKLDFLATSQLKPELSLFKVTDNISTLQLIYTMPHLTFCCENAERITETKSLLPITEFNGEFGNSLRNSTQWHFIGLVFIPNDVDQNRHSVHLYVNGKIVPGKRQIPMTTFSNSSLIFELGKVNLSHTHGCNNFGYISSFRVFDKALTKSDFDSIYCNESSRKNDSLLLLNSLTEFYRSPNILDSFSNCSMLGQFVSAYKINQNIDFLMSLRTIFEYMPISQHLFTSHVGDIFETLINDQNKDYYHYSIMYSILEKITYPELQIKWLEQIIFKIQLWFFNNLSSTELIIQHWYSVVLKNYSSIFQSRSWFSDLFLELHPYIESTEQLHSAFFTFLNYLAMIRFHEHDTRIVFDAAFSSAEKTILLYYLKFIKNISKVITLPYQIECLTFLHTLLRIKTKTVEYHKSSSTQEDIDESYYHEIFYILDIINELEIAQSTGEAIILSQELLTSKELNILLSQIMSNISLMPKFSPLIFCMLSLMPNGDSIRIPKAIWHEQFVNDEIWFIWPLQLFKIYDQEKHKERRNELIKRIAIATINSERRISVMQNICLYGKLLQSVSPIKLENNFIFSYLSELTLKAYEQMDVQFIVQLIIQILFAVFIHLNWVSHNKQLMDLFNNSPFNCEFEPINNFVEQFDLTNISQIFSKDSLLKNINPHFHLNMGKRGKIDGILLIQKARSFSPILKEMGKKLEFEYEQLINQFSHQTTAMLYNIELCDKLTSEFTEQFLTFLSYDFRIFRNESIRIGELFQNMLRFDFARYEKQFKEDLIALNEGQITNIKAMPKYRRSRLVGTCGYPNQIKTDFSKKKRPINSNLFYDSNFCVNTRGDDLFLSYQKNRYNFFRRSICDKPLVSFAKVNWISVNGNKIVDFKILNAEVHLIIDGDIIKRIQKSEIQVIFLTQKSQFEIQLLNGHTYLFDLSPSPNSIIKPYFDSKLFVYSLESNIKWKSNFEYLIYLNLLAGRSFNNLNYYPILPKIVHSMITYYDNPIPPTTEILKWNVDDFVGIDIKAINSIECSVYYPEFFYFPELFKSDSYKNSLQFVYYLRKELESEQVSTFLPSWIDYIFGISSMNQTVFQVAHPPKPKVHFITQKQTLKIPINISLIISSSSFSEDKFVIATESNQIIYTSVSINNGISLQTLKAINPQYTKKLFVKCFENMNTIAYDNESLLVHIFKEDSQILTKALKVSENAIRSIKFVNSDYIAYLENKCTIRIHNLSESNLLQQSAYSPIYNDLLIIDNFDITLFDISVRFSFLASFNINNELTFYSMTNGKENRKVKIMNKKVIRLLITNHWGFVVIYSQIHNHNQIKHPKSQDINNTIDDENSPNIPDFNIKKDENLQETNNTTLVENKNLPDNNNEKAINDTTTKEENSQEMLDAASNNSEQEFDKLDTEKQEISDSNINNDVISQSINDCHSVDNDILQERNDSNQLNEDSINEQCTVPYSNLKSVDCMISVFSLNGELIQEIKSPFVITFWKSISSMEGFDYIVFQDDSNVLRIFEAINPEKQIELATITDLFDVHYLQESGALLCLTRFGQIQVYPISIHCLFD